jgi:hypothetical protein
LFVQGEDQTHSKISRVESFISQHVLLKSASEIDIMIFKSLPHWFIQRGILSLFPSCGYKRNFIQGRGNMYHLKSFSFIGILIALLAVFLLVQPVSADDGATPQPILPQETVLPTEVLPQTPEISETPTATETPAAVGEATETPAATGEVTELPIPEVTETIIPEATETPAVEPTQPPDQSETDLAGVVTDLAESGVQLADAEGNNLILATEETAEVLTSSDPYFWVGTQKYAFLPNGGDCSTVAPYYLCDVAPLSDNKPIERALAYIRDHNLTPSDRKLHIQTGVYTDNIYINGSLPGLKGLTEIVGEGATPSDVHIDGSVKIESMAAGFTIRNLSVHNESLANDAAIWIVNNAYTTTLVDVTVQATKEDSSGIIVSNSTNVVLNRVESSNNAYKGADLTGNKGTVTVLNSTFNNNLQLVNDGASYETNKDSVGLNIDSAGTAAILLNGVSVSANLGTGAEIIVPKATVTVKNSIFAKNDQLSAVAGYGYGLLISSNIAKLENIDATSNDLYGIFAQTNSAFSGTGITARDNSGTGLQVNACFGSGVCTNTGAGTVSLKGAVVTSNRASGIVIGAKGAITVYEVDSSDNIDYGLYMSNEKFGAVPVAVTRATTKGNSEGIVIKSRGAVTLTNVVANENDVNGIHITKTGSGAVTITSANAALFNETSSNGMNGYVIDATGPITIINLNSQSNTSGYGGYIMNANTGVAQPVTIKVLDVVNTRATYAWNGSRGLNIISYGAVKIVNLTSSGNGSNGVYISNLPSVSLTGPGVTITNSSFTYNCPERGSCTYATSHLVDGLIVESRGLISLTNVAFGGNDGAGAVLNNAYSGATAGVLIGQTGIRYNIFSNNYADGLDITTNGPVTITNIGAYGNKGSFGVHIVNTTGLGGVILKQAPKVNFPGNTISGNANKGLSVETRGAVSIAFDDVSSNGGTGIYVYAADGTGSVTITGTTDYENNVFDNVTAGVAIWARGQISLLNIDCDSTQGSGAVLTHASGSGAILLTNASFNNNSTGLAVTSNGTIIWKNGTASSNNHMGAYLRPTGAATLTGITISGNGETGLDLANSGAILMTNVAVNGNGIYGALIVTSGSFTINKPAEGYNQFSDNHTMGLSVQAGGKITLNRVKAIGNDTQGIKLVVTNTLGTAPVILYDVIANSNINHGTWITTTGAVTVNRYQGDGNGEIGLTIDQTGAPTSGFAILLSNITANDNTGDGIRVDGKGNITLSKFAANGNDVFGVVMDNTDGLGSITILNPLGSARYNTANSNGSYGVYLTSKGAINVTGVEVKGNVIGFYAANLASTALTKPSIILNSIFARQNTSTGVYAITLGTLTINNSWSAGNGASGFAMSAPTTIRMYNTGSIYNNRNGIYATMGGSGTLYLTNCTWFGNLVSPSASDKNLLVLGGIAKY